MGRFNKHFINSITLITIFTVSIGLLWVIDSLVNILKTYRRNKKLAQNTTGRVKNGFQK